MDAAGSLSPASILRIRGTVRSHRDLSDAATSAHEHDGKEGGYRDIKENNSMTSPAA